MTAHCDRMCICTCLLISFADEMRPALKPRVPKPPESTRRDSLTPHSTDVVMRTKGTCLYDLSQPFSITLVSVSNVNVENFSLVSYL